MIDYFYVLQNIKTKKFWRQFSGGTTNELRFACKYRENDTALSCLHILKPGRNWRVMRVDATLTEVEP